MGTIRIAPGETIGSKWLLRRRIGRGGMGEVWVAVHTSLEQEVALKILDQDAFSMELLQEAQSRFHLEAQVAADLSRRTRHIASVIDHGHDDGIDYLVMELLRGESLEELLQRDGPMEPGKLLEVVRQTARGLAVAHADNVIHRDLKPSNIFVTLDDEGATLVKLLDFGIAKAHHRTKSPDSAPPSTHRTRAGVLLGTAAYMSPEQARGLAIDTRADLWAFAALTYELLTATLPFCGESDVDLLMKICTGTPAPPSRLVPTLSGAVDAVFAKAFAREVDDRWPDARAFANALARAMDAPFPLVTPAQGANSITIANYAATSTPPPMPAVPDVTPPNNRTLWLALGAGAAMFVVLVALVATRSQPSTPAAAPQPPGNTAEQAQPTSPAKPPAQPPPKPPEIVPTTTASASTSAAKPAKGKAAPKPATKPAPTTTAKKVDQGEIF